MGKKGEWKGAPWQQSSSTWSYWEGSWKNRQPKPTSQQNQFPNYSQTQVDHVNNGSELTTTDDAAPEIDGSGIGAYMRELQKALTACRKADGRLRKLQESRSLKDKQWSQYQIELKKKYIEQKRAYNKDVEALDLDLAQALEASRAAIAKVQHLAGGSSQQCGMEVESPQTTAAEDDAWNDLMHAPIASAASSGDPDELLAKALQEAHALSASSAAAQQAAMQGPRRGAFSTPPRGTCQGAPLSVKRVPAVNTPPAHPPAPAQVPVPAEAKGPFPFGIPGLCPGSVGNANQASADPYQVSPTAAPNVVGEATAKVSQRSPVGQKPRTPIKDVHRKPAAAATVIPHRSSFADAVQVKRAQLTAQLGSTGEPPPCGGVPRVEALPGQQTTPAATLPVATNTSGTQFHLLHDDEEDMESASHQAAGLTTME